MSTSNPNRTFTDRLGDTYRSLKPLFDAARWVTRQFLRFVAASATGAFVFMFTLSGTLGIPEQASYDVQTVLPLPADPAAMMVPVYLFALGVAVLAVARVGLRAAGVSRHWAVPTVVVIASSAFAIQNLGKWPASYQLEATAAVFAFFSVLLLAPVAVAAWILDQTAGGGDVR